MGLRGPKPKTAEEEIKKMPAGTVKIFTEERKANVFRTRVYNAGRRAIKEKSRITGKVKICVLDV